MKTQKEIIQEICEEFGVNQKELAKKIGISPRTIYKWSDNQSKIPEWFDKSINFIREVHKLNEELAKKYNK
jgi:DNA-binding XRE family transcriptional regulator